MGSETSRSGGRPRALCILGMHRSGTSAVTRAFNLLGAFVGDADDLMPATPANPEGYWERNDIYDFQERLLAAAGRRWDTGLTLPDGWQRSPGIAPYRAELKRIVGAAFAGRPLWAWKDPRTCILMDLWKDILGELETDLDAVFVVRHPRDVAASLGKRDGIGLEKACGIWFSHTLAALRSIEGVRTVFIGYDNFLEDPVGQVRRCAEALGLTRTDEGDESFAAIGRSVRKDLRHNQAAADALEAVPAPVRQLYGMIRQAVEKPGSCDGAFFGRIRELHREYSAYAGFFREDLEQWLSAELKALASERRASASERRASAAERRALVAEEQARVLDRQRLDAARALEEIVASRIWRITGPARNVADLFRGKARTGTPPEK